MKIDERIRKAKIRAMQRNALRGLAIFEDAKIAALSQPESTEKLLSAAENKLFLAQYCASKANHKAEYALSKVIDALRTRYGYGVQYAIVETQSLINSL